MSPPLLGVAEEGERTTLVPSSPSIDSVSHNGLAFKELNYLGLSDCSSVDSSGFPSLSEESKNHVNLKATELRLGLPGYQSPERNSNVSLNQGKHDEKQLFPLPPLKDGICSLPQKHVVSGNKRGFSDTVDVFSEVRGSLYVNAMVPSRPSEPQAAIMKELPQKAFKERSGAANGSKLNQTGALDKSGCVSAAKAQVVGWPPVKSFRKNSLATSSKNNDEVDGKPRPGAFFVKVSMDGAPYLRKVDLRTYCTYQELSSALEKMFSSFTIGQHGSSAALGREKLSDSKLIDLHGSEYVLTYEDKDGDWMLVGDVPWEMFVDTCKRLKIMKSSDAIGLAPRAMEKSNTRA